MIRLPTGKSSYVSLSLLGTGNDVGDGTGDDVGDGTGDETGEDMMIDVKLD